MDDVVLITPPAIEPITLDQFKAHAKVPTTADDDYISTIIIPGARQAVEDFLHRALITQTWKLKRDGFPGFDPKYETYGYPEILLPKPPFQQIRSFTYVDVAGITQTLTQANADGTMPLGTFYGYQVDSGGDTQPARLLPPWALPWPPVRRLPSSVQVLFDCGYGPYGSPTSWISGGIPPVFIRGILLQGAHAYYNREAVAENGGQEIEWGVSRLLGPYVNHIA